MTSIPIGGRRIRLALVPPLGTCKTTLDLNRDRRDRYLSSELDVVSYSGIKNGFKETKKALSTDYRSWSRPCNRTMRNRIFFSRYSKKDLTRMYSLSPCIAHGVATITGSNDHGKILFQEDRSLAAHGPLLKEKTAIFAA